LEYCFAASERTPNGPAGSNFGCGSAPRLPGFAARRVVDLALPGQLILDAQLADAGMPPRAKGELTPKK